MTKVECACCKKFIDLDKAFLKNVKRYSDGGFLEFLTGYQTYMKKLYFCNDACYNQGEK